MRCRKFRRKREEALNELYDSTPAARKTLRLRKSSCRPRIEEDQPNLLKTICDIDSYGLAAHEKRRDDVIRSTKTLNDLTEKL